MPERSSVFVVGSINLDLVLKVPRAPIEGESLFGSHYQYASGGKGANQAVALRRLGAGVTFVGRVGNDPEGTRLRSDLEQEGIDTEFVTEDPENPSGLAVILAAANARNSIVVFPGANMHLRREDVARALEARRCAGILLQLEASQEIIVETYRLGRAASIPVVLDAGPAQEFPLELLHGIDILSPNQTETLALTGIEVNNIADAERAARKLLDRSQAKAVVLKMGAAGALLLQADGTCANFPPAHVQAVDPTGAGDAFTAAMTLRYLETGSLRGAIPYANVAGALATTRYGAQCALPTAQEIESFRASMPPMEPAHV